MSDPYSVLGVPRGASEAEVQRRYRELAMRYHPDRNGGSAASTDHFRAVAEAYERIRRGEAGPDPRPPPSRPDSGDWGPWRDPHPHGPSRADDIFDAMYAQRTGRNRDVNAEHAISLEDAYRGRDVELTLNLSSGPRAVRFRVPPGVQDGTPVEVPGAGEAMFRNLPPGNLRVTLRVSLHPVFVRHGTDLAAEVRVPVWDVLLGGETEMTGIDGTRLVVTIPPCAQPDTMLRLRGQGMPVPANETRDVPPEHRQHRGDLLLRVRVVMPQTLSPQHRDAIEKIRLTAR